MSGFLAAIAVHTSDGDNALNSPELVRMTIGAALDALGIEEEIDYTLEIRRIRGCANLWHQEKGTLAALLVCPECGHSSL